MLKNYTPLNIVHVTEALGGGVLYLLHQLIKAQTDAGCNVTLIFSVRKDTPQDEIIRKLFPSPILTVTIPMVTNISIGKDYSAYRIIAQLFKKLKPDVIHLHSSKAGALGRLAAWQIGYKKSLCYSPHGFSFLRQDISFVKRSIYFLLELVAGIFGGKIIASCKSEAKLACYLVGQKRVSFVENCSDAPKQNLSIDTIKRKLRIISAGRLCYQKAPWRFWNISLAINVNNVDYLWIGDGELRKDIQSIDVNNIIKITGWIDRDSMWHEMRTSDIFMMTSLWEGMPLVLIDAQILGLPAVVPDVIGCRDVVIDGITGFVCKSDDEIIEKTSLLIHNSDLRFQMSEAAKKMAVERFSIERMNLQMLAAY